MHEGLRLLLDQPLVVFFFYPYFVLWLGKRAFVSTGIFLLFNLTVAITIILWQESIQTMEINPHENIDSFFENNHELNLFQLYQAKPSLKTFNFRQLPPEVVARVGKKINAPQLKEELNYALNLLSKPEVRFYYLAYGMDGLKYQAQLSRNNNNKTIKALETFYFQMIGPSVLFYGYTFAMIFSVTLCTIYKKSSKQATVSLVAFTLVASLFEAVVKADGYVLQKFVLFYQAYLPTKLVERWVFLPPFVVVDYLKLLFLCLAYCGLFLSTKYASNEERYASFEKEAKAFLFEEEKRVVIKMEKLSEMLLNHGLTPGSEEEENVPAAVDKKEDIALKMESLVDESKKQQVKKTPRKKAAA